MNPQKGTTLGPMGTSDQAESLHGGALHRQDADGLKSGFQSLKVVGLRFGFRVYRVSISCKVYIGFIGSIEFI